MIIKRLFAALRRGTSATGLPEQHAAENSLAETRANVNAKALALQAGQTATASTAARLLASVEQQISAAYTGTHSRIEALFSPRTSRLEARLEQLLSHIAPERLDAVEVDFRPR